ncbi:MAG: hypothetical protein JJ974_03650 [Phycisphaerales bacterium]|nr:hypothetical protein [Phycisphaerales bacterium]
MGSEKRQRLRGIVRWGVWVCTLLVLVSIPVSVWVVPSAGVNSRRVNLKPIDKVRWVELVEGRLLFASLPAFDISKGRVLSDQELSEFKTGLTFSFRTEPNRNREVRFHQAWWKPPKLFNNQFVAGLDIPLVYLAALMVGWSWWLIRGVKRRRQLTGYCQHCGYSLAGLDGVVCPECGTGEDGC